MEELLASDFVDVWQVTAGGDAYVRISIADWSKMYLESCVAVENIETLVRRAENATLPQKPDAEWFEEYVSGHAVTNAVHAPLIGIVLMQGQMRNNYTCKL